MGKQKKIPNRTGNRLTITTFKGKHLFYGVTCVECENSIIRKYPITSVVDISHSNHQLECTNCKHKLSEEN